MIFDHLLKLGPVKLGRTTELTVFHRVNVAGVLDDPTVSDNHTAGKQQAKRTGYERSPAYREDAG
jgi:hypothetical protein